MRRVVCLRVPITIGAVGRRYPNSIRIFANHRFEFDKRSQLFIRVHNETLSVVAMCVLQQKSFALRIRGCDAAPQRMQTIQFETRCRVGSGRGHLSSRFDQFAARRRPRKLLIARW